MISLRVVPFILVSFFSSCRFMIIGLAHWLPLDHSTWLILICWQNVRNKENDPVPKWIKLLPLTLCMVRTYSWASIASDGRIMDRLWKILWLLTFLVLHFFRIFLIIPKRIWGALRGTTTMACFCFYAIDFNDFDSFVVNRYDNFIESTNTPKWVSIFKWVHIAS